MAADRTPASITERVDELLKRERRPLTSWEIAMRLGEQPYRRIGVLLDKLTEEGKLAKFRVGTNCYYAVPSVAFTYQTPAAGTVFADSVKGIFITACLKVTGRNTSVGEFKN